MTNKNTTNHTSTSHTSTNSQTLKNETTNNSMNNNTLKSNPSKDGTFKDSIFKDNTVKDSQTSTNKSNSNNENKSNSEVNKDDTQNKKPPKTLSVDVNISGKVYTINCPADEVDGLKSATSYINDFIKGIRKDAPQLTHENLLVLCCLNLYEHVQEIKAEGEAKAKVSQEATVMVDKMIKDMRIL